MYWQVYVCKCDLFWGQWGATIVCLRRSSRGNKMPAPLENKISPKVLLESHAQLAVSSEETEGRKLGMLIALTSS
jgi:hypothetical protein